MNKSRESRLERIKQAKSEDKASKFEWMKQYSVGFYILVAGGIWALVEFVMAILYFF